MIFRGGGGTGIKPERRCIKMGCAGIEEGGVYQKTKIPVGGGAYELKRACTPYTLRASKKEVGASTGIKGGVV